MKNDAAQSDTGYPMKTLSQLKVLKSMESQILGAIRFNEPGFKIIRFVSQVRKLKLKFDRLRIIRDDQAKVTEIEIEAPKKEIKESKTKVKAKGKTGKNTWASQAQWNKERPGLEWVFTFMDKNGDDKVDSSEYKALQEFKKKHGKKWQTQARKEIKI